MSDESLVDAARRDAELLRLTTELRALRALNSRFELEVLNSRDFAVGQAAQIGELRHKLIKQAALMELRLHESEIHSGNYREHIARLESAVAEVAAKVTALNTSNHELRVELTQTRASTTWRLGRVLMFPVRVVKRLLRRG
ncbi:MAG: hypothetical protein ACKOYI_08505 [Actinomycetota bacterium]